jgi:uncharacterized protein YbjQ (UPF0145 family)
MQFTTAGTEGSMWGRAIAAAIDNARSGIVEELRTRGADGVVAMRFELEREHANLLTCTMLGTAVQAPVDRAKAGHPFATTLSARDFHLLVRAGYYPVGIVIGVSVVGFAARSAAQSLGLARDNVELSDQTTALYSAREQAMEMMEREAANCMPTGGRGPAPGATGECHAHPCGGVHRRRARRCAAGRTATGTSTPNSSSPWTTPRTPLSAIGSRPVATTSGPWHSMCWCDTILTTP